MLTGDQPGSRNHFPHGHHFLTVADHHVSSDGHSNCFVHITTTYFFLFRFHPHALTQLSTIVHIKCKGDTIISVVVETKNKVTRTRNTQRNQ